MKTIAVNIDRIGGIQGIQDLICMNPSWELISCGQTKINKVAGNSSVNFAVFKFNNEDYLVSEIPFKYPDPK